MPDLNNGNCITTFTVNGVSFEMIPVEGGTFTMGATPEQGKDYDHNESPTHQVTLSSYAIGKTAVTQALWKAVMGNNPSLFKGDNLPVENVNWYDCQEFIEKLNQLTGQNFRLPTEAEWEFAARGGNKSKGYKYAGSNNLDEVAWYDKDGESKSTHPIATKQPNELGIYDMSGNVLEWCSDRYDSYSSASQTNPQGASIGSYRVSRGGSWDCNAWCCRISIRNYCYPNNKGNGLGFRLCLSEEKIKISNVDTDKKNIDSKKEEVTLISTEKTISSKPSPSRTFTVNGVSFEMIKVESGTFTIGATAEQDRDAWNDEYSPHQVTLSSYAIGKTAVTQALWKAVMGSNPSLFKGDNLPVENVNWFDCQEFIEKLNQLTGLNFRLPTEAEWEFAARGGNKSKGYKYAGSNNLDEVAWYDKDKDKVKSTHPVATKQPNELGIYDMSGNVWEWCQDRYGSYSSASQTNPQGPKFGLTRVIRGGSSFNMKEKSCVSFRNDYYPHARNSNVGFRLCISHVTS